MPNNTNNLLIKREASCNLPTRWGQFTLIGYRELANNQEHVALSMGSINDNDPVLLRIHSECLTGDAFFSEKCDCGFQLETALKMIAAAEKGILIYLRQEGRGIGLLNKIKAYHLQDQGLDTVEANIALNLPIDARNFKLAHEILQDLNIKKIKLMTNNPEKIKTLKESGIDIIERVPLIIKSNPNNEGYIQTKKNKLNHLFDQ